MIAGSEGLIQAPRGKPEEKSLGQADPGMPWGELKEALTFKYVQKLGKLLA